MQRPHRNLTVYQFKCEFVWFLLIQIGSKTLSTTWFYHNSRATKQRTVQNRTIILTYAAKSSKYIPKLDKHLIAPCQSFKSKENKQPKRYFVCLLSVHCFIQCMYLQFSGRVRSLSLSPPLSLLHTQIIITICKYLFQAHEIKKQTYA